MPDVTATREETSPDPLPVGAEDRDFTLPDDERRRRWARVREGMQERGLSCLVVWGSSAYFRQCQANLRYLTNTITDGYVVFPLEADPVLISFVVGHDPGSWVKDVRSGHPRYAMEIANVLTELRLDRTRTGLVGLSGYYGGDVGFPHQCYVSLTEAFPGARFEDASDLLESIRRIKSDAEVRCLEIGCRVADHVVEAVADVAGPGVPEHEVISAIGDTLFRLGCEPGAMILFAAGKDRIHAGQGGRWQPASRRPLSPGDVILTEFDAKFRGYLAQYNQPFMVGAPSREWERLFSIAEESLQKGVDAIRPGATTEDLDEAFSTPILAAGYTHRAPHFHGVGLGLEEPMGNFPAQTHYRPDPSFALEPGMVIECEPQVVSPDGAKGLHIGIPVLVTETGHRWLSTSWQAELRVV